MKKSDLTVGMKIAMGKRAPHIILGSFHTVNKGTVIVIEIGKIVKIEVTARWTIFDRDLNGKEGPLETKTFELEDCRNILGPWDVIEKEYNEQVEVFRIARELSNKIETELRRFHIQYSMRSGRVTISSDNFDRLLSVLKSAP